MVAARLGCQKAVVGTGWTLDAWIGLENTTLRRFISDKEICLGSERVESADYYMLVNEWAWLRSQVCFLRLEVDLGSGLESKLRQK